MNIEIPKFTDKITQQIKERIDSVDQLEKLGNVWVSRDIALEKSVIIQPGELKENVNIILNKKDLPPINITKGAIGSLSWSVKSFFAQCGIEIKFHSGAMSIDMLKDINKDKDVLFPIDIINYGKRAVELNGNIMRFFWVNDQKRLRGKDLLNTIKSGEFKIEGKEGEDWYIEGWNPEEKITTKSNKTEEGLCIVVRLTPEKFNIKYSVEPIKKIDGLKTRDQLSNLLEKIPKGQRSDFEIGETPRIKLGPDIVAIINTGVEDNGKIHIRSPFIDSGSDWSIRTETNGLDHIELFLYRK